MMQRIVPACLAIVLVMTVYQPAQADWLHDWWNGYCHDYTMNKVWPQRFVETDRASVRMPFVVMTDNGWMKQNTMGPHYFKDDSHELTESGKLKVQHILNVQPMNRRTIWVLHEPGQGVTEARVQAVHTWAAQVLPPGESALVLTTVVPDYGAPAEYIDMIGRKYRESTPLPRLPQADNSDNSDP